MFPSPTGGSHYLIKTQFEKVNFGSFRPLLGFSLSNLKLINKEVTHDSISVPYWGSHYLIRKRSDYMDGYREVSVPYWGSHYLIEVLRELKEMHDAFPYPTGVLII